MIKTCPGDALSPRNSLGTCACACTCPVRASLSVCLLVGPSEALGSPGKLGGEYGEVVVFEDARVAYVRLG